MFSSDFWSALLAFVVLVGAASLLADRPVTEIRQNRVAFEHATDMCDEPAAEVQELPATPIRLFNNGFVRLLPCFDGHLTISMVGSEATAVGAHTLVSQRGLNLWEGIVTAVTVLELPVEGGFWVTIAFVNDSSGDQGDRNLWLEQLSFARH